MELALLVPVPHLCTPCPPGNVARDLAARDQLSGSPAACAEVRLPRRAVQAELQASWPRTPLMSRAPAPPHYYHCHIHLHLHLHRSPSRARPMSWLHAVQQDRLSSAELAALAESVQLFDAGQFRSSLRAAERVLARHPAHAEALAVQALGRAHFPSTAAQSISTARRATSANVRSVLCWHALAICYRKNQRFAEALKAYAQAARLDPTSFMMVREAALMSVMLHHHAPAIEFQLTALRMQPHVRTSWTQLAVSHHLAGSLVQAIRVLDAYQDVIQVRLAPHCRGSAQHTDSRSVTGATCQIVRTFGDVALLRNAALRSQALHGRS